MSSQRPPWQICSWPRKPQARYEAGESCNAHRSSTLNCQVFLLTLAGMGVDLGVL